MLVKFKVKNFKKFKDELVFDFAKVKKYTFNENIIKNGILNTALIYGCNGSGKSNLGFAMFDVVFHTTDNEKIKKFYDNYLYGNGALSNTAKFTYEFKFQGQSMIYTYSKENVDEVVEEELYLNNKKVLYINRETKDIELEIKEAVSLRLDNIFDSKLSLLKYVLSNVLFDKNSVYFELKNYLERMLWFRSIGTNNYMGYKADTNSITNEILEISKANKDEEIIQKNLKEFEKFLKEAGINLTLSTRELEGARVIEVEIQTNNPNEKRYINFWEIASSGTLALANFYSWYKRLDNIRFVFIDEFDAFYHYKLSKIIIKKLKEKNNTQFVLTTHATNLMDNELLRPDAYFILKDNTLKSLPELTDKKLREAHNIEKLFKSGAFDE
ncbi:MAG: ATP-binding protein [Fusobacterium varium]|uniref:AAA family ATPase n=1 Tax=Fusobacterium varium TaxID=856 RepID=UPI00242CA4EF|nr:AAA family ATPase [Fusobacterium varium]MCF0170404.1 ATP-binding protein [Fusobacterium varium]